MPSERDRGVCVNSGHHPSARESPTYLLAGIAKQRRGPSARYGIPAAQQLAEADPAGGAFGEA
jgi:hypothetical protein